MLRALIAALVGGVLVSGCGSSTDPTPEPVLPAAKPLQVSCPTAQSVDSPSGTPVPVAFPAPAASGGAEPITTTCNPASGSPFLLGSTPVSCTARDAQQRTAACSFTVSVTRPGQLSATRFMAFGDSITFGVSASPCSPNRSGLSLEESLRLDARLLRSLTVYDTAPATSYPSVLQGLLKNRYFTQAPILFNEGLGGEFITDGVGTNDDTLKRLRERLAADLPQVVLLMEGINDINELFGHNVARVPQLVKALRDMIREVKLRGGQVMLGTLLPVDPSGCRGKRGYDLVEPANIQIRALAVSEGLAVVDLHQAFGGVPGPYIGIEDGLHPTPLGYQKMAETFFETIKTNLEH